VNEPPNGTIAYRVLRLEQWQREIEDLKPEVLAERVSSMRAEMRQMKFAFWALVVVVVGASVGLAVAMFQLTAVPV